MNWKDYISEAEEILEQNQLDEKMVRKYHVEHGLKKVKIVSDKPGYRIEYDDNHQPHEVKITKAEEMHRRQGAKVGKLKHNKPREQALRKKSFLKRERINLDYNKDIPELNARREDGEKLKSDEKGALKQKLHILRFDLLF